MQLAEESDGHASYSLRRYSRSDECALLDADDIHVHASSLLVGVNIMLSRRATRSLLYVIRLARFPAHGYARTVRRNPMNRLVRRRSRNALIGDHTRFGSAESADAEEDKWSVGSQMKANNRCATLPCAS